MEETKRESLITLYMQLTMDELYEQWKEYKRQEEEKEGVAHAS